jgi:hypothetical protein
VGSFSDCESRTSNPDAAFLVSGYEDRPSLYDLQRALEASRRERDEWISKFTDAESNLKQLRTELEETKARVRAVTNENEILRQEKESLSQKNKDLIDHNAELQETVDRLKKSNRKSGSSSPPTSNTTVSESSDEKKLRRSSSKRHKEKERDREKDKEQERAERQRERDREARRLEKEKEKAKEREETERLRKRFESARGEESDAKSSNSSSRTQRNRRDSYIEPLGQSAPRPQAVPPSPSRQYSSYPATTTGYPPTAAYASIPNIREPYGTTPRSHHPTVLVDEYSGYPVEEEDLYRGPPAPRSVRHPR